MKISKILAGVSALAVMATMVITASAKTTFTITDLQDPEWTNCFPKWTDGTTEMDDYIDAKSFKRDTPMEVTVIYDWTQDGIDDGYVNVKPASAAKGWNPLGGTNKKSLGYLADMPMIDVTCSYDTVGFIVDATGEHVNYCIQKDGSLISNNPNSNEMTFTVTAEGVNALIDSANADGGFDGILIQTSSAQVKSIVVSQDGVTVASTTSGVKNPGIETTDDSGEPVEPDESTTDESTTDESTTDESTTDDSATDSDTPSDSTADSAKSDDSSKADTSKADTTGGTTTNNTTTTTTTTTNDASPNTGAAAAAVAGIALAGAAIVIAKKR